MLRKIWRIRVYESIFKFFSDLISTWWIIKIVFYKNFRHIIIHKIVASLKVLNSSFFSFFLFVTNSIDRTTCKNVIEKTNAQVIVCLNLKFFVVTKRWKGKKFFESNRREKNDRNYLKNYSSQNFEKNRMKSIKFNLTQWIWR